MTQSPSETSMGETMSLPGSAWRPRERTSQAPMHAPPRPESTSSLERDLFRARGGPPGGPEVPGDPLMLSPAAESESRSIEPGLVGRGPVDRRHRGVVEPQVDRELPAMVREVHERVPDHDVTRVLAHDLPRDEQPPGFHEVLVCRPRERLARLGDAVVKRLKPLGPG